MNPLLDVLPPQLRDRLVRELDEGEAVLWVGQPVWARVRKETIGVWRLVMLFPGFFSGMFLVAGLLASFDLAEQEDPLGFFIGAGAVLALGVLALPALLWSERRSARNTIYAVTEWRAITIVVHRKGSITERDYRGDELAHLARLEHADGTGTLTFEGARRGYASSQTTSRHKFNAIPGVIEVERILRARFGSC